VFGSDVAHRMVDFAQRNAERAGVARAVSLRGGDALQRLPPIDQPGVMLLNPPYGERIAAAGVAGQKARGREAFQSGTLARQRADGAAADDAQVNAGDEFFARLAAHWKSHYAGWSAWLLTPDLKLPGRLRLKESRRVPLWNGPIECRLFQFTITKRTAAE
jgi:putative N6-adenine-specific DNA methylase